MHNVVIVEVLDAREDRSRWCFNGQRWKKRADPVSRAKKAARPPGWARETHGAIDEIKRHAPKDGHGVRLGELALLRDALEQLAALRELEREVVLRPRLEPLVELDLHTGARRSASTPPLSSAHDTARRGAAQAGTDRRTMFGWSSPRRTSISPQTLLSFPLTFFFGMTLSATSTVSASASAPAEVLLLLLLLPFRLAALANAARPRFELEPVRVGGAGLLPGGAAESGAAAAPRRATLTWPGGTCHVALWGMLRGGWTRCGYRRGARRERKRSGAVWVWRGASGSRIRVERDGSGRAR